MLSIYFKKCGFCGRTFPAQSKMVKYCSDECRNKKKLERAKRRTELRGN